MTVRASLQMRKTGQKPVNSVLWGLPKLNYFPIKPSAFRLKFFRKREQ
ncbi:hypothetical protein Pla144_36020 [Bythopirellula polymerisocia]|uniref:Uncharacterized protein n=1 Tax=Bythopirellula polymerisocia TaxID=2528003 RepID=A0A5C6CNU1_9BACT|nr:hypothetical protein Pla144_36020 [Bythopirellula polymerisocia]